VSLCKEPAIHQGSRTRAASCAASSGRFGTIDPTLSPGVEDFHAATYRTFLKRIDRDQDIAHQVQIVFVGSRIKHGLMENVTGIMLSVGLLAQERLVDENEVPAQVSLHPVFSVVITRSEVRAAACGGLRYRVNSQPSMTTIGGGRMLLIISDSPAVGLP
jgi:hypothetical protein